MDQNHQPFIELVGNPVENFAKLGQMDKETFLPTLKHTVELLRTPFKSLNTVVESIIAGVLKQTQGLHGETYPLVEAYCQELGYPVEDFIFAMLVPELTSCLQKWIPGGSPFGCSSFLTLNSKTGAPIHGRILDFPLHSSYDVNQRAIKYAFSDEAQIINFSSSGLPVPGLTCCNEAGMTLAIHQKFTPVINIKGTPIFELAYGLIKQNFSTPDEVINYLNGQSSLTTWCFIMTFPTKEALIVDIMGDKIEYQLTPLSDKKILYYNNDPLNSELKQIQSLPYGVPLYNKMRRELGELKIDQLLQEEKIDSLKLLKAMGTPFYDKAQAPSEWRLDPLTPSTLTTVVMSPLDDEILYIPGLAPKTFLGSYGKYSNLWGETKEQIKKSDFKKSNQNFHDSYQLLMKAQVAWDHGDYKDAYHFIQMAESTFKHPAEKNICRFYFLVFQYIHERNDKVLEHILVEFKSLEDKLPSYLNENAILFVFRLEKILGKDSTFNSEKIKSNSLKKILKKEQKIPKFLFHKITSMTMTPRIDTLDIIYPHAKI